jgi:DNA mismatch repair protein MutS
MTAKKAAKSGPTPMIRQYLEIKEQYPSHILMFRMGDFYEMFFEDAERAAKILNIALTSRSHGEGAERIPLCGVPYHALTAYLKKMIDAGVKVAICDQLEDPRKAKGIVKRGVTRLVSPGLVIEAESLDDKKANYMAALVAQEEQFGIAAVELSTGEFKIAGFDSLEALISEIVRVEPAELVVPAAMEGSQALKEITRTVSGKLIDFLQDEKFDADEATLAITAQFPDFDPKRAESAAIRAAGGALAHLHATQLRDLTHLKKIEIQTHRTHMVIDEATKDNLELVSSMREGGRRGSLLWLLDKTETAMGARLLHTWICYPLLDREKIGARHRSVEELVEKFTLRDDLRQVLSGIQDLERLAGRVGLASCSAKDLNALKLSLELLPQVRATMNEATAPLSVEMMAEMDDLADLRELIEQSIHPDPPFLLHDGGLIADGYNADLDELRAISRSGKGYLSELERKEREETGIAKLKVKFNKVFGYYIEVSNAHLGAVPDHFVRKQTLVNAERFITEELKQFEDKVLNAEEKIVALEYSLFTEIRNRVADQIGRIQQSARVLAVIDVLAAFAESAQQHHYVRPHLLSERRVEIIDGRHPVVEVAYKAEQFVPNDTSLNGDNEQVLIITGPNMAGKSTYIRQVALIQLMCQVGSFVPATEAHLPVADRIFTRVGASDNLARGQSTFMVEMTEAANILAEATDDSLVILDEIGRGTSTFDGLAIAWAVAEYLHDSPGKGALTLFATHYHELTDLMRTKKRVKNYNVAVKEWHEEIIFLRKIVPGGTSRSYGIQVARLAGLPDPVIKRAHEVLKNLETKEFDEVGRPVLAHQGEPPKGQLNLFRGLPSPVEAELAAIDIDGLSPIEALNLVARLKKKLK